MVILVKPHLFFKNMKKVLIVDLDNTIYAVKSIGDKLFASLFKLIDESDTDLSEDDMKKAKEEIMRRPFQKVADEYGFGEELTKKGVDLLKNLTYDDEMSPFEDYHFIKDFPAEKFLVTTGFVKLQQSKIKGLKLENDFKEFFVVDPETSSKTKKDIFTEIMSKYQYKLEDVLVVGDDPESEIDAATELGIDTFLLDRENRYPDAQATYKGKSLKEIEPFK
jgi:putative hydrolase of the HAD superfamily